MIQSAMARRTLELEDSAKPWAVIQACYAAQLSEAATSCLINGGVITREQRADAVAILRSISDWLERARPC